MSTTLDTTNWHSVTISIPFPQPETANLIKKVIEVDKVLRPLELIRNLTINNNNDLIIEFLGITISQCRVALDHCLSDLELILKTINTFSPTLTTSTLNDITTIVKEAPSLEIGLRGSWNSITR